MPIDGPYICGTAAEDGSGGGVPWTGPTNITVDDLNYAVNGASGFWTYYLKATNFGHGVPSGATINEIKFSVYASVNDTTGSDTYRHVYAIKGGTMQTGYNAASEVGNVQNGFSLDPFIGDDGLWDLTWTDSDVNASDFGVAVSFTMGTNLALWVDYITSEIDYTPAGVGGSSHAALFNFLCRHDRQHHAEQGSSLWQPSPKLARWGNHNSPLVGPRSRSPVARSGKSVAGINAIPAALTRPSRSPLTAPPMPTSFNRR